MKVIVNLIFPVLEPLKLNEAFCCSSSAKVAIKKLPSSLMTVAHQVYKLTYVGLVCFLAHFRQIYILQKPSAKNV
jgi:hypothetical protein